MSSYTVHITKKAERDIDRALEYIEFVLKNPGAADTLFDEISRKLSLLSDFPKKSHPVDDPVLSAAEIRFLQVRNYLAFYRVDENVRRVIILRFLHEKADWMTLPDFRMSE